MLLREMVLCLFQSEYSFTLLFFDQWGIQSRKRGYFNRFLSISIPLIQIARANIQHL